MNSTYNSNLKLILLMIISFFGYASDSKAFKIINEDVMEKYIQEYHKTGKPINIAVGCASREINERIKNEFESMAPAKENWVGIDLQLCMHNSRSGIPMPKEKDKSESERFDGYNEKSHPQHFLSNPDIQMNAYSKSDWKELIKYFKKKKVELSGIMFEGLGLPLFRSAFLWKSFFSLLKKGGKVYGKGYINLSDRELVGKVTKNPMNGISFDGMGSFLSHSLMYQPGADVRKTFLNLAHQYHEDQSSPLYKNEANLLKEIYKWMKINAKKMKSEKASEDCGESGEINSSHISKIRNAEVIIAGLAYANRIKHFNPYYISSDWRWKSHDYGSKGQEEPLFSKDEDQFFVDYLPMLEDLMKSYGFKSIELQCPVKDEEFVRKASCKQMAIYKYEDGTYDMSGGVFITK